MTRSSVPTSLAALQALAAVVDGIALSTIVLHVTAELGLAPSTTGMVLAAAATTSLLLAGPLGAAADRLGLRRAGAVAAGGSTLALTGYAVAESLPVYAISAVTFVVAQAVGGAIRQALAVEGAAAGDRLGARATMHTLLNVGLGAGTVAGAGLVALGPGDALRLLYLGAALASAVGALVTWRVRTASLGRVSAPRPGGLSVVIDDHRFLTATALASIVQLTMPMLSVLLPVWVLLRTPAPAWTAAAALALNTVLVIVTQRPWSRRVTSHDDVIVSSRVAAAALLGAGVLFTLSGQTGSPVPAVLLVALAVIALTCAEVTGGATTWAVALRDVPPDAEGRYQSVFSMSTSAARIIGPAIALPLVTHLPHVGWVALTAAMTAAIVGIARLAPDLSAPTPVHPSTHRERTLP